ncbi:MFS transporter [Sphingomonas baiyangensis]|uniref:MFS transporter n=1 Tax=Sphingomonas baiyangensis TaxID=2572576 RepID=A0A4U1L386_9SPHN|nr:MFS transporter [Sphingomonas baiyangensis]TKD50663.1 MFS transporter [Sphingomonas baiyangensis]
MTTFRIQDFIDAQRTRPIHYRVLAICTFVMFVDGFDIFLVGKIAPAIARGLGEEPAAMTLVFLLQQIGLAIGAFVAPPLADRFGRKRMLVWCSIIFGLLTLATSLATSITQFAVMRGIAGVFLSGGLPMAVSLLAEHSPRARRGTFISIAFAGYSAGGAAGGAVAAWMIDDFGWQSGFWLGGLMPLAGAFLMLAFLPESLQFITSRNPADRRIAPILRRLDPDLELTGQEAFVAADGSQSAEKASLFDIFRGGRGRATTILWMACVLSMGTIALMAAWLPTFFQEMAGIPIQRFAVLAMLGFFGGLCGTLTMGWLFDRVRASRLIPSYYLGLSAMIFMLALVPFEAPFFLGVLLAYNFFQTGGQTGLNTMMTRIYPASMRSTGIGWAGGMGRIGGIILPLFGGLALASEFSLQLTLAMIATMPLAVAILVLLIPDLTREAPQPVGRPATA